MPAIEIQLPSSSTFHFSRTLEDGSTKVVLVAELVYIDALLTSAQNSARKFRSNPDDRMWWLPTFTQLVNNKFHTDLTQTECYAVAVASFSRSEDLKKNMALLRKSLPSTESMPTNSTPNNSKGSTSTSEESKPSENLNNVFIPAP